MAMSFSALNGDWLFNNYDNHGASSIYGYLALPVISIYDGIYSMFVLFESVRILFCIFLYRWLSSLRIHSIIVWCIVLLFFIDRQMLYMRQEALIVPIIFVFYFLFMKRQNHRIKNFLILTMILILLHPMAALLNGFIFISLFLNTRAKIVSEIKDKSNVVTASFFLIAMTFYLQSSMFNVVLGELQHRVHVGFNFRIAINFLTTSFPLTIVLFIIRWQHRDKLRLIITTICFFLTISFFEGYYYYSYLQLYLVLDIIFHSDKTIYYWRWSRVISVFLVCVSVYTSLINDIFVYTENPEYSVTIKEILKEVKYYQGKEQNVYISPEFALPILNDPKTKMLFEGKPFEIWSDKALYPGDILLFTERGEFESYRSNSVDYLSNCNELVPATKGMLSIKKLYKERVNEFGLWECVITEK